MDNILEFLKTDTFLLILFGLSILMLIGFIINTITVIRVKSKYKKFMKKLGKGEDLEEMISRYTNKVNLVDDINKQIIETCKRFDSEIEKSITKVGMIRYSAFKNTGSDLSFALALLNEKNDGIVLNGIYSREMSNIYGKPIVNGNSEYTITAEEREAIEKAISSK